LIETKVVVASWSLNRGHSQNTAKICTRKRNLIRS
jgi:hypothetical protein